MPVVNHAISPPPTHSPPTPLNAPPTPLPPKPSLGVRPFKRSGHLYPFLSPFPWCPCSSPCRPARPLSLSSDPSLDLSSPHADLDSLLPATGAVLLLHDQGRPGAEGEKGTEGAEGEKGPTVEEGKEGGKGESSREDDAELARRLQVCGVCGCMEGVVRAEGVKGGSGQG
ncbi:unnamed protein product [Closterium sp. Naga37s-1]|nr:unnamed protein product [Closterium sp. Naga37s-1]